MRALKISKNIAIAAYVAILVGTGCMAIVLCLQYRSFMQEAQELIQVRSSYAQYVEMLKRSLNASLAGNDSESDDEPEEADSKKINELNDPLRAHLFITSIDEDKSSEPEFGLINTEEENQLSSIKQVGQKLKQPRSLSKKKKSKRAKSLTSYNQSNRYAPVRDFAFIWPIELSKFWLSSLYGPRRFSNGKVSFHHGIDMASMKGTAVKASAAGTVQCAQSVSGYGNCIDIYHNEHYKTRYAHLNSIRVRTGQSVQAGQFIATVGDTGFVRKSGKDASHLHFEVHYDGQSVNPLKYLFT